MSFVLRLGILAVLGLLSSAGPVCAESLVLSELFYHPTGTNHLDEWFELHNAGTLSLDLSGWRITRGVDFTFPAGTQLPAGAFLVVAADPARFSSAHPDVNRVTGGWSGTLRDSGDTVEIQDTAGAVRAQVTYADEGDWAIRRLAAPDKYNKRGWEWHAPHAGEGRSLELVNERLPASEGQNWLSSTIPGGTPGQPNSVAVTESAPLITAVHHFPPVPRSTEAITVVARLVDETMAGISAVLHWRVDEPGAPFAPAPMRDDGAHGDGLADDGVFGAILPAQPPGTVIEFHLTASDSGGRERTYPAFEPTGESRSPHLVFQVDDELYSGTQPHFRLIATRAERDYLETQIWAGSRLSDAEINGTFIARDGVISEEGSTQVRYLCGFRNRGHGTRSALPHNFRVHFPADRPWQKRSALNLNSQYTPGQALGSAVFRALGVVMAESRLVQLRWNGSNLASTDAPQWGSYAANEAVDASLLDRQIPDDAQGNLYRGIRDFNASITPNLVWHGPDPAGYTNAYFKQNNSFENQWSDLVGLIQVLNNSPDDTYAAAVRQTVNVRQWMLYFAIHALLDNQETCLGTGVGDDFILYFPASDGRAQLWSYDMDSILGRGTSTNSSSTGIFKAADLAAVSRFLKHPEFAPEYHRTLQELSSGFFAPERFDAFLEQWRAQLESTPAADPMVKNFKAFNASRVAFVRSQLPLSLTAESSLPVTAGYPRSTTATTPLGGTADAARTASVRVNGVVAAYTPWQGRWAIPAVALHPGVNRVLIHALDAAGAELERRTLDIWYDDSTPTVRGGTVAGNETWSAASGPYQVNSNLTIGAGATLVIEPGTSVFFGSGVNLTVANGGRLLAEGTAEAPIYLGRNPGAPAAWGGIVINGGTGSPETRITHASIEGNGDTALHSEGGTVFLDHVHFGTTDHPYLSLDDSSWTVSHCHFPAPTGSFEPLHGSGGIKPGGHGLFLRNFVGAPNGYNDAFDFTGGNRPGQPVVHFIGNVLAGSGDDGLDLDGTDAWVEGNLFLHIHRNGAPDSSAAVSGGSSGGQTSEVTLINNLFFDCDNAVTAKQGNFYTLFNNTIVRTTNDGGVDFASGIVNLRDTTPEVTTPGRGFYLEGNLITDAVQLARNPIDGSPVTFVDNLLPQSWTGPGSGNRVLDARLTHVPTLAETRFTQFESAQILWNWFAPAAGSPARGAGFGGRDLGASRILGVVVDGAPRGTTASTSATLRVGPLRTGNGIPTDGFPQGTGYVAYRWRLDGGIWSPETPISEPIVLSGLTPGNHEVEVSGKRDTGLYQDDPLLGDSAVVSSSGRWTVDPQHVDPTAPAVRLSELMALNRSTLTNGITTPDWVELENTGATAVDLSGMAIQDSANPPRHFEFPTGTMLAPGTFLVVFADDATNAPGLHLGFGLSGSGDSLILRDAASRGGAVLDSVVFGVQIEDAPIGRGYDGVWTLCEATPGAANIPALLGDTGRLRINEWLAHALFSSRNDFLELYNPDPRPVSLGGLRLSDASAQPDRFVIPALSFIAGTGYLRWVADGSPSQGADHLSFRLPADSALIRLSDASDATLDLVSYGPQRTDVSQGRSPDGSDSVVSFSQPTPGGPNPGAATGPCTLAVETIPLLGPGAAWRYQQTANLDGTAWKTPGYPDSSWPSGGGFLGAEDCDCLPAPGLTTTLKIGRTTYYFRTHFNVATNLAGFTLNLSTVVDDGAVVYLNGNEVARVGMPAGIPAYSTQSSRNVGNATTEFLTLPPGHLVEGDNVLAVEVHQTSSSSTDIVWGAALEATRTYTNCSVVTASPVVINEIFAKNLTLTNANGQAYDWIELHNPSTHAAAVGGFSLTDDPAFPRKWVLPAGTALPAGGFLTVDCDPLRPAGDLNTGFSLNGAGGTLYLFDDPVRGGSLLDAVSFGMQAADFAVGRVPDGADAWLLTVPGPAAPNLAAGLGNPALVRINEWMAEPTTGPDWFELFNTDSRPVALGGLFLTDDLASPFQSPVPPLSFLGSGADAWREIVADGNADAGGNHVRFSLKRTGESIALFSAAGQLLDGVAFGSQSTGTSEGRYPDGADSFRPFPGSATPGAVNSVTAVTDADADGLPDSWETAHGLDPRDPIDAGADPDGDGLSNLEEFRAGTDPRNSASALRLVVEPGDPMVLKFAGVAGRTYRIETRPALAGGTWTKQLDVPAPASDQEIKILESQPSEEERYYRVVIP